MQAHCTGFLKLLAPFYPLLCTGDIAFILSGMGKINVQMLFTDKPWYSVVSVEFKDESLSLATHQVQLTDVVVILLQ